MKNIQLKYNDVLYNIKEFPNFTVGNKYTVINSGNYLRMCLSKRRYKSKEPSYKQQSYISISDDVNDWVEFGQIEYEKPWNEYFMLENDYLAYIRNKKIESILNDVD